MVINNKYNIGDNVSWETVKGTKGGVIEKMDITVTASRIDISYLIKISSGKYCVVPEESINE